MGVLDTFVFLLSADEEDAVKGIDRTGQAFEDLKDKGKADSKAVASSFEEAASKIEKVANDIGATLSGIEGTAELSRSADQAALDFTNLGDQVASAGDKINRVTTEIGNNLSGIEGTAELSYSVGEADKDFDNLGKRVNSTGDEIVRVAGDINDAFGGMDDVGELSHSVDKATLDFINLGNKADATGDKISSSIASAVSAATKESNKLANSLDDVDNTNAISALVQKIKGLTLALRGAEKGSGELSEKMQDDLEDVKPKVTDLSQFIHEKMGSIGNSLGIGDFAKGFIATAAAGMSLNAILDNTANLLNKIRDAETVGVDIGDYDVLLRTFTTLGVETDEFRDSMIDLNEAMGEAAADAESGKAKAFKTFGVELKTQTGQIKATDEALLELADSMSSMSKQQATFQIKQLGITDNKVIAAMLSGRKELERMMRVQREYGTLSQEDAEQVKRFSGAVNELKTMTGHFADELTVALAPAMTMTVDGIALVAKFFSELFSFLSDHKGLVAGVLLPVALVVLPTLTASLWAAASAVWAFLAPLLPFIAIAVALGLVVDDLWNYFTGGESVIGDLAKKFTWLNDFLQTTKELVLELIEAFKEFANNPMKTFESWGNSLKEGFEDAKGWLGFDDEEDPRTQGMALANGANSVLAGASNAPTIPSSSVISNTRGGNTVQQTNDIKITVPNGDAETISQGVQQGLDGHLDSTMAEFDDGRSH